MAGVMKDTISAFMDGELDELVDALTADEQAARLAEMQ